MPKIPFLARYQQRRRRLSNTRRATPNSQSPRSPPSDELAASPRLTTNSAEPSPSPVKIEPIPSPSTITSLNSPSASKQPKIGGDKISLLDTAHPSVRQNLQAFLDENETGDTYSGFFYNRKHIFIIVHDANTHAIIARGEFKAAEGGQIALDYVLQMPGCKTKDYTIDGPVGKGPRELWAEEAMTFMEREAEERGRKKAARHAGPSK